jgi:hypothetical protein
LLQKTTNGLYILLFIYVFFNLFWGLNYDRYGSAYQFNIKQEKHTLADLTALENVLLQRLNTEAARVDSNALAAMEHKKTLFAEARRCYDSVQRRYPFLAYSPTSLKPSLFSYLGNYLGFQGYYNPFSGEGQVNTTVPVFLRPYICTHEMAHQLGYAKEMEANFIGFLAAKGSPNAVFRYSAYYDVFWYTYREIELRDTALAGQYYRQLHPRVVAHVQEARAFFKKYRNPLDPVINKLYSYYLNMNRQPMGMRSYNQVVGLLIGYRKQYGDVVL